MAKADVGLGKNKAAVLISAVLKNSAGSILLLKRSYSNSSYKGLWQFPEGKIQVGEGAAETLTREVYEETKLSVTSSRFLICFAHTMTVRGTNYDIVRIAFLVKCKGKVVLSEDHKKFGWFSVGKLPKTIPGTKKVLSFL